MTTTDLSSAPELERKYDVSDETQEPGFEGFQSERLETLSLRASYFDTGERALLRHRITLRRRAGGHDDGWHIKTPLRSGRLETRAALSNHPPASLLDRVRAIIRDAELVQIATVSTERSEIRLFLDGTAVAEFSDDRVTASDAASGTLTMWREWEVELLPDAAARADAEDLLDRIEASVISAGAVNSSSRSKLARVVGEAAAVAATKPRTALEVAVGIVHELTAALIDADMALRAGDRSAVHEMRKTLRRLRAVLATTRPVLASAVTDDIRERLSDLAHVLAPVREAQVRREQAARLLADERRADFPAQVRERLEADANGRAADGEDAINARLDSTAYFRLLDDLELLASRPPIARDFARKPRARFEKSARKQLLRVSRRLAALDPDDLASMHRARKAARRFRYAVEALSSPPASVLSKRWRAVGKAAKAIQDAAGEHRDTLLLVDDLTRMARDAATAGENSAFYGMLAEAQSRRAESLVDDVMRAAESFRSAAASL